MYQQPPSKAPNQSRGEWIRWVIGTVVVIIAALIGRQVYVILVPPPSPTLSTTASASTFVIAPTVTPAHVVYLMTLQPSSGVQPMLGLVTIGSESYPNSFWYIGRGQADDNGDVSSTWMLSGRYHQFQAWLGVDETSDDPAQCISGLNSQFEVSLDGTRVALKQVPSCQSPIHLIVNVTGAQQMTLMMTVPDYLYDNPEWGNASLT